jgi:hypothetical protein
MQLHTFLISAQDEDEWSASPLTILQLGRPSPPNHCIAGWVGCGEDKSVMPLPETKMPALSGVQPLA